MADSQAEIHSMSKGLPRHIFNNLNQTSTAKEIWDNVEKAYAKAIRFILISKALSLIQKTLTKQEQSTSIVVPLRLCAHTTSEPVCGNKVLEAEGDMLQLQREGHVAIGCGKEPKRKMDTSVFKVKAFTDWKLRGKGMCWMLKLEAFLADVECYCTF
ncbi:hypothetical protein Tco_1110676 [Tanacetum coccineum]|uniref:Uncharacterized protein n=1 Tax=Tanacetum coccineum TaxID=301880 RepID=A0ABQ5IJJ7_9ASTR